jgi:hypothetical protein
MILLRKLKPLNQSNMTTIEMQQQTETLDIEQMLLMGDSKEEIKDNLQSLRTLNLMYSIMKNSVKPVTLKTEICKAFGIKEDEIFQKTRKREIVNARQTYIYLIMATDVKKKEVKKVLFGDFHSYRKLDPDMNKRDSPCCVARHIHKDHATIYHACKITMNYYDTENFYRDLIERLRNGLFQGSIIMPDVTKKEE